MLMLSNWCWRRLLRVLWISRRSNQLILKEISPEYSLEGLMLKDWCWSSNPLATCCEGVIGKDQRTEKDWRQEEKGMTEDEMAGWHHWLCGHEFDQSSEDSEGQGRLKCFSLWGGKESDMTEWLNNNELSTAFAIYEEGYSFNLHQILSKVGEKPQSMI